MSLLEAFVDDLRLRRQAESTITASRTRIRQYLTWCAARDLDPKAAGHDDFLAYLRHLQTAGHKTTTLQREFVTLVSFYEFLDLASAGELKKIRKKYLRAYKPDGEKRQIISVQQAQEMIAATCSTRDQAILQVLFKTGIRRGEITAIDVSDVDMDAMTIRLKPTGKRSNRLVFFDREAQAALRRWLVVRQSISSALFTTFAGERLGGWGMSILVKKLRPMWACTIQMARWRTTLARTAAGIGLRHISSGPEWSDHTSSGSEATRSRRPWISTTTSTQRVFAVLTLPTSPSWESNNSTDR